MRLFTLLMLLCAVTTSLCNTLQQEICDVGRMVDSDYDTADVVLAGLFNMRHSGDQYSCGTPNIEQMLAYEAARWSIKKINSENYLNGIKMGLRTYDTCASPYSAVAAANHFYQQFSASSMYCNQTDKYNLGILGAYTSWTSRPVAELTAQFPASMISPIASSPELSDKSRFPYFMRTAQSSSEQIRSTIAAMKMFGWERILIVYTDNAYGADAKEEMVRVSRADDICVVDAVAVPGAPYRLQDFVKSLENMGKYDVNGAAFFGENDAAVMTLEASDQIPGAEKIQWMFSNINMKMPIIPTRMRGGIYVQQRFTEVTEFFDYFTTSISETNPPAENPWYRDWFMTTFQCRLQGVDYLPYSQYSDCVAKSKQVKLAATNTRYAYVDSTIMAVYAYAKALKNAQVQACGNQAGMCLGLKQMTPQQFHSYLLDVDLDLNDVNIDSLRGLRVKFDSNGDLYKPSYTFWQYNNQPSGVYEFKEVGTFVDNNLILDGSKVFMYNGDRSTLLASVPTSPCPASGCNNCFIPRPMVHFTYAPGHVVLAGLFDIHAQGSEVLVCGALKPMHALNVAAFRYAIRRAKINFPDILHGVDLGSLIIDMCDNGETGRLLLNNILGERHVVANVDPNLIKSVVGELDSTEAMSMASMLGQYSMPYIESAATSIYLYDKTLFPTFTRGIPSDYHQMLAIVLLLKRMEWNYVQVIHTSDTYGTSGFHMIKSESAKRSICIAASHEIGNDVSHDAIISKLKQKPDAKAVVVIADGEDYRMLLAAIQSQGIYGQFVLIGTETWGKSTSVVTGYESVAEGSITIAIESPEINEFRQWLGSLTPTDPDTMEEMPFFAEWYQYSYSCYLDAKQRVLYSTECNPAFPITQAPRYEESSYTAFMIYSTYAAARALDKTIRDYCGDANGNYEGLCWEFRSNANVKDKILEYLKSTEFSLDLNYFKMMHGEGQANYDFYSYSGGQYIQIGTYDTMDAELQLSFTNPISLPPEFMSQCTSRCSECVYLVQNQPFIAINEDADLQLGVHFALSNPGLDPFLCGNLRLTNGFQSYLAVAFALHEVNSLNARVALNNVKVGGLVMDYCNSPARAYGMPSALYSGILGEAEPRPNINAIRAWLTDFTMVTEEMKDFFSNLNLPVIGLATTNTFLNDEEYPTFLRTVQGDSTIASALAVLAKSLGLQYVTVVYSANSFGREGMETFYGVALQEGLCIIKMIELDNAIDNIIADLLDQPTHVVITYLGLRDMDKFLAARGRNSNGDDLVIITPEPYPLVFYKYGAAAKNLLSLRMRTNTLHRYKAYLGTLKDSISSGDNPYLSTYYMDLFQCNLPGEYKYATECGEVKDLTQNPNFYTDNYVLPLINSVYTFVAAAHETLKIQCGEDYQAVCAEFYSDPNTNTILLEKMRGVSYVDPSENIFQFIGKEGNTAREIVMFDGVEIKKVADFAGASINIQDRNLRMLFESTRSSCISPCTECINNNMNFTHIPGDVMLGGIFDVHMSALTPFSCGSINTLRGFQLLEAFHFAINQVNDKSGQFANILKNVKLGGLGLDACQSAVKGGYLVSNIQNGLSVLERDGVVIDPDTIEAYIGTYSSGMSIYLARLLKSLKIPQVSFGSTSVDLLDQDRYPYFLRTVPADDRQAMGMIKFLRRYDIRYIQVVHTADNYGEQGAHIFNKLAVEEKVCVAQTISFLPQNGVTVENANDVVLDMLKKPVANTVVIFADTSYINALLQAIRRNPDAHGKFKFVGSDTWANNMESIDGVEDIALGSVTMDLDVVNINDFDLYLASKTPANYPENPWFPEYYEEIQNCYLTIPDTKYPGRCSATPKKIVTSRRYKQDTALIHVINAVYSAAYGIDLALREECGNNYTTVCEAFKTRDNRRDFVLEKIKQASFVDLSGQPFSFSDRGDGNKGYVLYSLESSNRGYTYNPIANYTSERELIMLEMGYTPAWDGSCERVDSCTECPTIRNLHTRYMLPSYLNSANNPNPATLVYVNAIHGQGNDAYRCGAMNMENMMRTLSIIYAIQHSNLNSDRPFNLRTLILDNCDNQIRIDQDLFNMLTTGTLCNAEFDSSSSIIDSSTIMGVQTQSSRYVVAANRVTSAFKIQLMSGSATSAALSDQWRYPYFARTVPPDDLQMEVIARILKEKGWSYVSVVYSLESYGINAYRALQKIINDGLYSCIGIAEGVNPVSTVADLQPVVKRLAETNGIGVIVLVVVDPRPFLEAVIAEGVASRFLLIGTDTWAAKSSVTIGLSAKFAGAITIDFRNAHYNGFVDWMKTITFDNRVGIPDDWFEEFYQHIHKCQLLNSAQRMTEYTDICAEFTDTGDVITEDKIKQFQPSLTNVAASYAMAKGLSQLNREYGCADKTFSTCMAGIDHARERLFNYTLEQTWNISPGQVDPMDTFSLELGYDDRFWDVGYNIYSLQPDNTYNKIGSRSIKAGFQFDVDNNYDNRHPGLKSQCPEGVYCDCAIDDNTFTTPERQKYMGDHEPRNYFVYNEDTGEQVYDWPIWAVTTAVLTCIGLAVGLILFFYFLVFYPVRGGTTILGFMMMLGLFGIYATNFAFFKYATATTCGLRRFLMGVVYSVVFAPLLVKAVDNWRFKDSEYSQKRYMGLTNPCALVLIALGIILVQCIIPVQWLILRHPSASLMADAAYQHDWNWCDPHDFYDFSLVLSMVFVLFLILLTTIFSALAWDSESNYYESRWIFLSCVCSAGCMLVWMVVSTNAGPPYRDPIVAIANFVNATALLICMPIRKLVLLVTFSSEEEKAKTMPSDDADPSNELYATVYTNQMYQNDVFQPDEKSSSEPGY